MKLKGKREETPIQLDLKKKKKQLKEDNNMKYACSIKQIYNIQYNYLGQHTVTKLKIT